MGQDISARKSIDHIDSALIEIDIENIQHELSSLRDTVKYMEQAILHFAASVHKDKYANAYRDLHPDADYVPDPLRPPRSADAIPLRLVAAPLEQPGPVAASPARRDPKHRPRHPQGFIRFTPDQHEELWNAKTIAERIALVKEYRADRRHRGREEKPGFVAKGEIGIAINNWRNKLDLRRYEAAVILKIGESTLWKLESNSDRSRNSLFILRTLVEAGIITEDKLKAEQERTVRRKSPENANGI